jgi:hypothetical protein
MLQAVELRVQLWSVIQRATEAKIRCQETSSEDIAEEQPLWRAVTTWKLVKLDWEHLVWSDL